VDLLAGELREGKTSSRELVEQALAKISDPAGEGARAFIKVDAEGARNMIPGFACVSKRRALSVPLTIL
jgi:aspartyl-tRNA(Asn)/glutamyl-tRNA(Gln) amidotransferase subunit A